MNNSFLLIEIMNENEIKDFFNVEEEELLTIYNPTG